MYVKLVILSPLLFPPKEMREESSKMMKTSIFFYSLFIRKTLQDLSYLLLLEVHPSKSLGCCCTNWFFKSIFFSFKVIISRLGYQVAKTL